MRDDFSIQFVYFNDWIRKMLFSSCLSIVGRMPETNNKKMLIVFAVIPFYKRKVFFYSSHNDSACYMSVR